MGKQWDFILGGSKITADADCSHEIKRRLLLGRNDQPRQHIKKQRHYFANKGPSTQSFGFSSGDVWMWELNYNESQVRSILKEISPEYPLEGLMLKLTFQYFGHLMGRTDSLERTLMLGKTEGGRRGQQRMRWLDGTPRLNGHEFE